MIRRRVYLSGALLLAALAAILIYEFAVQPGAEKRKNQAELGYPDFKPDLVKRIEISRAGRKDILVRSTTNWLVESEGNSQADPEGVQKILEETQKLSCNQEVSVSESEHARFDLTKDQALEVKMIGEKEPLADFYVGKRGTTYTSSYYRKSDQNRVCLTYQNLISAFDRTNDSWKDKAIFSFNAEECKALQVQDGATTYRLEKDLKNSKWELVIGNGRKPAAAWAVDGICQTLSKLKTQAFPSAPFPETGLVQPLKSISIDLVGDKNYTLLIGSKLKDKSDYYVQRRDKNVLYSLTEWQINSLFKNQNELLEKGMEPGPAENPPPPAP